MIFERKPTARAGASRWRGAALLLAATAGLGGCANILDVENPNNLIEQELENPASATSLVNGAGGTVARAIGALLGPYSVASDEAYLIGSRDAWRELQIGQVSNPRNEFTDDAFRYMAQARWMADEAVMRVEGFNQANQLTDRTQLARAYLFAAIARIVIGDMFEDYTFSDRRESRPPVGAANMSDSTYGKAIDYLNKGLVIAQAANNVELQRQILGTRARAKFSRGVWAKLHALRNGQPLASPLVNDAEANADARAALALMAADYQFNLTLANDDLAIAGEVSLAYNINQRPELSVDTIVYGVAGSRANPTPRVKLPDPVSGQPDPVLANMMREFTASYTNQPILITSAREMRLILAEAALAEGNMAAFGEQINAIRELNSLPAWTGQVPALDLLKHTRRVTFFLQGRRLADMYRFGETSRFWQLTPPSTAIARPGSLLPITCVEIRAHPQDFDVAC